jgi:hypothetical protein
MTPGPLHCRIRINRAPARTALATAALIALLMPARATAQCEGWRAGPFATGPDGTNGTVQAITQWDPDGDGPQGMALVVGGSFTSIEGTSVSNLAMRDPATGTWVPVGAIGSVPIVNALTVFEGKLVVGVAGDDNPGTFDETVRTWDGSSWEYLGTTNTGSVYAMHVHDGSLYVGGSFWTTHTTPETNPAFNIARWNPVSQAWDNLNSESTDGQVRALASWNGELIVGGSFTIMGGLPHRGIARWNGGSWLSMGLTAGNVRAIQPFIGGLYVGGGGLSDGTTSMGGLGRWNGSWSSVGGTFAGSVAELSVYNGRLIIAGSFGAGGSSPNITQFDGGSYSDVGGGIGTSVDALFPYGGVMHVGGSFTTAGGLPASHLARWNGNGWSTVGGGSVGGVLAMTEFMGGLVVAGGFSQPTFGVQPAVNIVRWDGMSLTPFGAGVNNQVNALKGFKYPGLFGSYELIAGGYFTQAGGVAANRIARWQAGEFNPFPGPDWEPMGAGMDGAVLAIERYNGATYAGGNFWASGAVALANIGRWNEASQAWENIVGSDGPVYALKAYGGYLYAGGSFTAIGGVSTGGLARYNGSTWSAVGGFFLGSVYSLEVYNGVLAIGGDFTGINFSPDLAYYNGFSYGTFGTGGSNVAVTILHANGSRLYVGGTFTTAGGVPANHVAYWDGVWHGASGGANNSVYALGSIGGEEQVGGVFTTVGASVLSPGWARYSETGVPWFVQQPYSQSVTAGTNVSFTGRTAPGYGTVTLQWQRYGAPVADGPTGTGSVISGANGETLLLENVSIADAGYYQLVATNSCGSVSSFEVTLTVDGVTAAPVAEAIPSDVFEGLGPNPTRGAARMAFALARDARVQMRIHDVAGRLIRQVDAGAMPAGRHQLTWDGHADDGHAARAGLYFVRLEVEGRSLGTRRLVLQR